MKLVTEKIKQLSSDLEGIKWATSMDYFDFETEIILSNRDCGVDALLSFREYCKEANDIQSLLAHQVKLDKFGCFAEVCIGNEESWAVKYYLDDCLTEKQVGEFINEFDLDENYNGAGESFSYRAYHYKKSINGQVCWVVGQRGGLDV